MSLTSIIITTHDRPLLLRRAIESALAAGTNTEVIVVDDASTDETAAACRNFPGIKYVRSERNQRVAGARNVGLLASSGEFVSFLDDDDQRLPTLLDEQVALLEADKHAGLIYGQSFLGDQSGQATNDLYPLVCPQGDVFWNLLGQNFIPCGTAVFRRACLDRVGLLDSEVPGLDDWDLWIRIAELYPIMALAKPVMIWRRSTPASGQGSSQGAQLVIRAVRQFRRQWLKLPRAKDAPAKLRRAAWQEFSANMGAHLIWEAMRCLRFGDVSQAARNVFALLSLGPLVVPRLARKHGILEIPRKLVGQARKTSASYSDSISRPSV